MQAAGRQVQGRLGAWLTTAALGAVAVGTAVGSALTSAGPAPASLAVPSAVPGGTPGAVRLASPAAAPTIRTGSGPGTSPAAAGRTGRTQHPSSGPGAIGAGAPRRAPGRSKGPGGTSAAGGGPGTLAVDAHAWSGHGLLAVVSAGQLRVVGPGGAVTAVSGPGTGPDTDPAWAPDHRWLAFEHRPAGGGPPTLWVVTASGGRAQQVGAAPIGTFAWSPFADQLAFTTVDPATGLPTGHNLWTDLPGGQPVALGAVPADEAARSLSWSPDGQDLAIDEVALAPGSTPARPVYGDDLLVLVPTGGGPAVVEHASTTGGLQIAGWWPNGTGVLFWDDPGFATATGGEPLESLALGSRQPTVLGTTLVGRGFVVPAPPGGPDEVAVVLGAGHGIADAGRHVAVCALPAGTCRRVTEPAGQVSLGPAWTASGLALVSAPATAGTGPAGPRASTSAMAAWDAASRLQVAAPPSWAAAGVPAAGGAMVWVDSAASGSEALVVRGDALWLVDLAGGHVPVPVAGPLFAPATPLGDAGRVDWGAAFAWSAAPVAGPPDPGAVAGPSGQLP